LKMLEKASKGPARWRDFMDVAEVLQHVMDVGTADLP
jgi:hypothetical protein